ncbi:TetR/AcrR family transcriptional regulator [Acidovorax sp. NCPPB 3576]|uniref:TetR/AcrR family transcriptional regulator n=1 Tax=Acidovorax sp. NCPPB 3576 TaxID=2940488 RepID=UPI00234B189C|nr:TetR/AcrR family transcriptional regulator [Acidovorax sp. NCPPB 3576]WCM90497.1 TetR/AcrR family transcriptional regulator [Acidovorax sp. NCPPB 3576]
MEDIRVLARCSKGTLYSYFSSKEDLFLQALLTATDQEAGGLVWSREEVQEPIDKLILRFGVSFLSTLYSPRFQALRRLAFSASDGDVGRAVYTQIVNPYEVKVADLVRSAMDEGTLRRADPHVAAQHLCGLLESEFFLGFLLHAIDTPSQEALEGAAHRGVQVFLAAYQV